MVNLIYSVTHVASLHLTNRFIIFQLFQVKGPRNLGSDNFWYALDIYWTLFRKEVDPMIKELSREELLEKIERDASAYEERWKGCSRSVM